MLKTILARAHQGHRTIEFPRQPPNLPDRYRGLPIIDQAKCGDGCLDCVAACPTDAIERRDGRISIDLGKCLFCTDCSDACPDGALGFSAEYQMATRGREDLKFDGQTYKLAGALEGKVRQLFGRSLKLRQVSAAGCNACEADISVLNTVVFDLGRFGIQIVASPRHADGLIITGPVGENMRTALKSTYDAVPPPKLVIAVGACAISGGPFAGNPEVHNGASSVVPVDLFIPGCPPHPITILDGLLRLMGRIEDGDAARLKGATA